ncbi:DUF6631 family protein [Acetonema longum]|uniref:Uncharacterized protein n=1 Tax=Acetonema longum DSM 6540 TaxID=1009370 RepID=F7NEA1_9FIRM|nr:DUF6631 family protein [Acetonema longum]EGO65613.1 hypothetical protein ALO_01819 [Acetonema longum DSM 6540]
MATEMNELDVLFPNHKVILAGEEIQLRPFPFGAWPEVIAKAAGIVQIVIDAYQEHGRQAFDVSLDQDNFHMGASTFQLMVRLFSEGGDNLLDILAICANKPRAWVDALDGDDGLTLLAGTLMVNRDFFSRRVLPKFQTLLGGLPGQKENQETPPVAGRKSAGAKSPNT